MKPPPRTRNKPNRDSRAEPVPKSSGKVTSKWQRPERVKLLNALKTLGRTEGVCRDIDYELLKKKVPTRSISEIHSFVEALKNKVISYACLQMKKKRWQENKGKPIEVWTNVASMVAGTLEESIDAAFSQMLIVSSTEPRTLRNCDPPQVNRPPADIGGPIGRTIAFRPVPCLPAQGEGPGPSTRRLCVLKTPAPTMGPAKRLQAPFKVVRVPNSQIQSPQQKPSATAASSPAATHSSQTGLPSCPSSSREIILTSPTTPQPVSQTFIPVQGQAIAISNSAAGVKTHVVGSSANHTPQPPLEQQSTTDSTISPLESTSSSPRVPPSSSATSTAPPSVTSSVSATSSCIPTHPAPTLSTPTAAIHAKFGRTSKFATKDSPRTLGVKCIVDFERIYRYLSAIPKPNEECHLTPMESAIMLDLLMSLPEELPLLDCNNLQKHLKKMYQCLSSPANSKMARETFADLKGTSHSDVSKGQGSNTADSQHNTANTVDSSGVMDNAAPGVAASQSSGSNDASGHTGSEGFCPPLNPFMVPLKLLMRK